MCLQRLECEISEHYKSEGDIIIKHYPEERGPSEKKCTCGGRCFSVTLDGKYVTKEQCIYRWGKLKKAVT
jgi:hypothetical protein